MNRALSYVWTVVELEDWIPHLQKLLADRPPKICSCTINGDGLGPDNGHAGDCHSVWPFCLYAGRDRDLMANELAEMQLQAVQW